jgi:hypothetical protein
MEYANLVHVWKTKQITVYKHDLTDAWEKQFILV